MGESNENRTNSWMCTIWEESKYTEELLKFSACIGGCFDFSGSGDPITCFNSFTPGNEEVF